jgi:hypothetical protein
MKWILSIVAVLMLAGCGSNIEWFPDTDPTIDSFSPTQAGPGAQVTINGTYFSTTPANNIVKFNGTAAVVTGSNASQIVTTVPTGATTGPITVTVGSKTATSAMDFTVSEADPMIASFSPLYGLPGAAVTINGTGFSTTPASNTVKFNGTAAVVTSATASQIVTTVPTGATTGPITVAVGSKTATSATNFSVSFASFISPFEITMSGTNLYVTDQVEHSIRKIEIATGTVSTLPGTASALTIPAGITTDGANLYVIDQGDNTIKRVDLGGGGITTLPITEGFLSFPAGIAKVGSKLYVTDQGSNIIWEIVIVSGAITPLSGSIDAFISPAGITTDGTNLYVADQGYNVIKKIEIATGDVTLFAGSTTGDFGLEDGTGTEARFSTPTGITTDGTNLYVADQGNNRIRKIVIATKAVTTLQIIPSESSILASITTDGISLYIVDQGNNEIMRIQ